jgi:hypothetical protein
MLATDLRPLSLGELLDRTFSLYRNRFWLFVGIMAVPQTIFLALSLLIEVFANPQKMVTPPAPGASPLAAMAMLGAVAAFAIPLAILAYAIYHVAMGATTEAVSQVYLGGSPTIGAAYQRVRGRVGALMAVTFSILLGVIVVWIGPVLLLFALVFALSGSGGGGSVAAAIGALFGVLLFFGGGALAVWVLLRYSLAIPVLILEKIGVWASLRRSARLTSGHRGRIFLLWLLMVVITYAGVLLFQVPFLVAASLVYKSGNSPLWFRALVNLTGGIGGILTGPLYLIGVSLFYYDIRVRKEALDIQLMLDGLPREAAGSADAPPALPAS